MVGCWVTDSRLHVYCGRVARTLSASGFSTAAPRASGEDESMGRGRPLHCGVVRGISGLSPLSASSDPPAGTPRNSSGQRHVSPVKCKGTRGQRRSPLGTGRESRAGHSGAQTPEPDGLGSNPARAQGQIHLSVPRRPHL